MLPPDFLWTRAVATAPFDTVIACDGVWVAQLYQERGTWFAFLDRQRPDSTLRRVRCTGLAQGRGGAEAWVTRYQARLRAEVDRLRVAGTAGGI